MNKVRLSDEMMARAFELFDSYNQNDPSGVTYDGLNFPATYFYALKLHDWVLKLDPHASDVLLLASRCQHIGRWEKPRISYPDGKAGYLNWRSDLAKYHASKAAELLAQAGCPQDVIEQAQHIILKKKIKLDPEVQLMENALCLVFLEYQLADFIKVHDEDKVIRILKKSWFKMDEQGRRTALGLSFSDKAAMLIGKVLE